MGTGDLDAQVDRAVLNTRRALAVAGVSAADVVRSVVLVGVAALGFPGQLVELELTAALTR